MHGHNIIINFNQNSYEEEELPQREKKVRKKREEIMSQTNLEDEETLESTSHKNIKEEEELDYEIIINVKDTEKFEYLDHTADVQLHSWGHTIPEAFAYAALAMFNYMTPLNGIKSEEMTCDIVCSGHDIESLLFAFLDEFLFIFHTEFIVCKKIEITEFNKEIWKIKAKGYGEIFDREKHECGTEVKAITYSAMQIFEAENDVQIYVIVDI